MSSLRIKCVEALRRLGANPRVLPWTALLLRALTVRRAGAFMRREALGRRGAFVYRLRENDLLVGVRHGTGDVVTLGEVFHDRQYEPPAELEQTLSSVRRVLDLGANIGLFGAFAAARWPQAEIVAFEPDPDNASLHERAIELNALGARWRLVRAAAGASAASADFIAGGAALAHLAGPLGGDGASPAAGQRRIAVEVHDVLDLIAGADLLKLDIEGGEWAILSDPRFRQSPPRAVVLEYHPRFCPGADPREMAEQALAEARLRVRQLWHRNDGHGMLWGWRG